MATELELKVKVADLGMVRQRLGALGAACVGMVLERNTFFDTGDGSLVRGDRGLRLRTNTDLSSKQATHIVTYKGAREPGALKRREEIEFAVVDPDAAASVFVKLGYEAVLSFEKRRESWQFLDCKIELDELPHLGTFIEIEGPTEAAINTAREKLELGDAASVTEPYIALLMDWRKRHDVAAREIRF